MSHISAGHTRESYLSPAHIWDMTHSCWNNSLIHDVTHSYVGDSTHSYVANSKSPTISGSFAERDLQLKAYVVPNMNESSHVTCLIHMWHDVCIRNRTRSWHDSFPCDMTHSHVTRLIHMWHDVCIRNRTRSYVTWLIPMWHDSSICDVTKSHVTWFIHTCDYLLPAPAQPHLVQRILPQICDMTHFEHVQMRHDSFWHWHVKWLVFTWRDMTHSLLTRSYAEWLTYDLYMTHIWMSHVIYEWVI